MDPKKEKHALKEWLESFGVDQNLPGNLEKYRGLGPFQHSESGIELSRWSCYTPKLENHYSRTLF